jgi:crotonobetainyl-CoA:carnitine CoA-transferase CaiB-like acyl-CoA transferase
VVDHSTHGPGPFCSSLLVRLGARVIKLEPPGGDPARAMPTVFEALNRGKESVVVDLREASGRELATAAVRRADVFLHSWRPGVAERLGQDAGTLLALRPSLVYCSISGFGTSGQRRLRAGQEITYLAAAGVLAALYGEGPSRVPGLPLGDTSAGTNAALRIVAALLHARSSGHGGAIDVSIAGGLADWAGVGAAAAGTPLGADAVNPAHGVFATADGGQIAFGVLIEDRFWSLLWTALGEPDRAGLALAERTARAAELRALLADAVGRRTTAELTLLLEDVDLPWELVRRPGEIEIPGGLPAADAPAPALDGNGAALRRELAD